MQLFTRCIAKAALALALAGVGSGGNATITVSQPAFIDDDTFQVMVTLADPFGTALDSLNLELDFASPVSLAQVLQQPGVPGTLESPTDAFHTISYVVAATIPTGPLFQLRFDLASPPVPGTSIGVTVTGLPTFIEEEFPPISLPASITLIPEPATYALLGAGLALAAWTRRWRIIARG